MSGEPLPVRGGTAANGKISLLSEQAAATLTRSGTRWSVGEDAITTVSYAFRVSGTVPLAEGGTFQTFTPTQIVATELALSSWSDVANIRFSRVGSGTGADAYSSSATILFGDYVANGEDDGAAFANFPGSRSPFSGAGDVWVSAELAYNRNPVVGDYGQQVLVHEIGHAIGLSHPSSYDASDDQDPTYAASAAYYEDARQYTIMSYFASSNTGASLGAFAAAPQMDDIAAVQRLYGANYATRSGDTVYGFNATADRPWYRASGDAPLVFTVWDGGGYDRLDFSGYAQNQRIDLRQGAFSDVGGWVHNVGIAIGVTIEEAVGGGGADVVTGNDRGNALLGGGGADRLYGGTGNDHLYGAGRSTTAGDGADTIVGDAGSDYLQGNGGDDSLAGGAGSDRIFGGQGNDAIVGEDGNDTVNGNLGDDRIDGGNGDDRLRGGQGDDRLLGGAGNDALTGDLGNDRLEGGSGLDVLTGGSGADIFVLGGGAIMLQGEFAGMADAILDFEDGVDHLVLAGGASELLYGSTQSSASLAEMVAYARQIIDPRGASAVLAVGYGGDTFVFSRAVSGGDPDATRLIGIADPYSVTAADFI